MINYYLRPDQAHIRIDDESKVVTNVLNLPTHKFIGNNTDVGYVDNMINMANNNVFTVSTEETFNNALAEVKVFISAV